MTWRIIQDDCVAAMAAMPEASVDAVVTDPPYGLEFMGKDWDKFDRTGPASFENLGPNLAERDTWRVGHGPVYQDRPRFSTLGPKALLAFQAWCEAWAREALRVLKPGGFLLAFGGTRTYHRLACAVEDAGFEIRDRVLSLGSDGKGGEAVYELGSELDWIYGSG